MRSHRLQFSGRLSSGHVARGFTMAELMLVVAIIAVVMAIAVPSFSTIQKDLAIKQARSDVYAALTAARTRAITSRNLVALHIFRDSNVYRVDRNSTIPSQVGYDQTTLQSNSYRWGVYLDPQSNLPTHGIPHPAASGKMIMRLEMPNSDLLHMSTNNPNNAVEFVCVPDHDPVVLPDSLGLCRPGTMADRYVNTENGRVNFGEDFYIVFAEDGKLATVLVDYNLAYDPTSQATRMDTNRLANPPSTALVYQNGNAVAGAGVATWSAGGLCLYETPKYKSFLSNLANQYSYVNGSDCLITLSPYTGRPLIDPRSAEASR